MRLSSKTSCVSAAFLALAGTAALPATAEAGRRCPVPEGRQSARDPRVSLTMNVTTGQVYEQAGNMQAGFHPASTTKIVTMLVIARMMINNELFLNQEIRLSDRGGSPVDPDGSLTDPGFGLIDRTPTLESILEMMGPSSNRGPNGVQEFVDARRGQGYFVEQMNAIAREAGATNTLFTNASGYPYTPNDRNARTTAEDMAKIVAFAQGRFPDFFRQYLGNDRIIFGGVNMPGGDFHPTFNHTSAIIRNQQTLSAEGNNPPEWAKTGLICHGRTLVAADVINGQIIVSVEAGMGIGVRDSIMLANLNMARDYVLNGYPGNNAIAQTPQPLPGGGYRMFGPAIVNAASPSPQTEQQAAPQITPMF